MSATGMRAGLGSLGVAARLAAVAHGVLALVGLLALLLLAVGVFVGKEYPLPRVVPGQPVGDLSFPGISVAAGLVQLAGESATDREQRAVTEFISRRYRVADQAVAGFVATAYQAGREFTVDPVLILAVMAIESRYNPVAESLVGARGLMQVMPQYHPEKLVEHGGESALLDPEVNIRVGTRILRDYLRRFGETEAALQVYGGAADERTAQYANKVLAERARLEQVVQRSRRPA